VLKCSHSLLVKTRDDLEPEAYLLEEEFCTVFENVNGSQQAEWLLRAWIWPANRTTARYLAKSVNTLHNWWSEIPSCFGERIASGVVGGVNREIRSIIGQVYGYCNFDRCRLQVLVQHGPPVPFPTVPCKACSVTLYTYDWRSHVWLLHERKLFSDSVHNGTERYAPLTVFPKFLKL
jgi:hypothetical protein